jgi:hypothetical protein
MKALNLLKEYLHHYSSKEVPEVIDVEAAKYVSIPARGSFLEKEYYNRIEALKRTAHALKNIFEGSPQAFDIAPLEALYWYDEKKYGPISISHIYDSFPLSELEYRLMIRIPEYITPKDIVKANETVASPYKALASKAEFFELKEGKCVQMLHLGSFNYEGESLNELERFVNQNHLVKNGLHHEIYLVDFTLVKSQEGLRTILREPVKQTGA